MCGGVCVVCVCGGVSVGCVCVCACSSVQLQHVPYAACLALSADTVRMSKAVTQCTCIDKAFFDVSISGVHS